MQSTSYRVPSDMGLKRAITNVYSALGGACHQCNEEIAVKSMVNGVGGQNVGQNGCSLRYASSLSHVERRGYCFKPAQNIAVLYCSEIRKEATSALSVARHESLESQTAETVVSLEHAPHNDEGCWGANVHEPICEEERSRGAAFVTLDVAARVLNCI